MPPSPAVTSGWLPHARPPNPESSSLTHSPHIHRSYGVLTARILGLRKARSILPSLLLESKGYIIVLIVTLAGSCHSLRHCSRTQKRGEMRPEPRPNRLHYKRCSLQFVCLSLHVWRSLSQCLTCQALWQPSRTDNIPWPVAVVSEFWTTMLPCYELLMDSMADFGYEQEVHDILDVVPNGIKILVV